MQNLIFLYFAGDLFSQEKWGLEVRAISQLYNRNLQFLHLKACHNHHIFDILIHWAIRSWKKLGKTTLLQRFDWRITNIIVELQPLIDQTIITFLTLIIILLIDQVLVYLLASLRVKLQQFRLWLDDQPWDDVLGAEVGIVDEFGEVVLVEDAIEGRDQVLGLLDLELLVLAEMLSELADESQYFLRGFGVFEEDLVSEQVEYQKYAGLILPKRVNKIDEVLDRPFLIRILLLIQHLSGQLKEEDDHLQFIQIHQSSLMPIDEVNQHQHALLRCDFDQLIAFLANPQDGHRREDGKSREAFVAEELNQELILVGWFHYYGLEQLYIVLDGLSCFFVDVEALEEVLVDYGLREDVDKVVDFIDIRHQQVEQL